MKKFLLLILLFQLPLAAFAADTETLYLPAHARDVTMSQVGSQKIRELSGNFVKALESKDIESFRKLTTNDFRDQTDWEKSWAKMPVSLNAKTIAIKDFFIMRWKDGLFIRFSVTDKNGKVSYLPPSTWYEVKQDGADWKMQGFWPNFEPDSGP